MMINAQHCYGGSHNSATTSQSVNDSHQHTSAQWMLEAVRLQKLSSSRAALLRSTKTARPSSICCTHKAYSLGMTQNCFEATSSNTHKSTCMYEQGQQHSTPSSTKWQQLWYSRKKRRYQGSVQPVTPSVTATLGRFHTHAFSGTTFCNRRHQGHHAQHQRQQTPTCSTENALNVHALIVHAHYVHALNVNVPVLNVHVLNVNVLKNMHI